MATQGERKAETRERLLAAAAELFAERGVEGSSVDAIAERADRTSGAIYDHFGGKSGLLFALLESWTDSAATVISAEVATASTLEDRLEAIWRNVATPPSGDGGRWILLEHQLWSSATRDEAAREHLLRRYSAAWRAIDDALADWAREAGRPAPERPAGPAIIGVLLGLEMMRRLDPNAIDTSTAVSVLLGALGVTDPEPAT